VLTADGPVPPGRDPPLGLALAVCCVPGGFAALRPQAWRSRALRLSRSFPCPAVEFKSSPNPQGYADREAISPRHRADTG